MQVFYSEVRSLTSLATLCVEKAIVTREEFERRAEGHFPLGSPSVPGYIRGKTGIVVTG